MINNIPIPLERNLFLSKRVDQESVGEIIKSIISINSADEEIKNLYKVYGILYEPKPIKLYIDSYGGNIYQCFGLISVMEKSNIPIHTIVTGCAMSAGFIILISGHKRFAYKLSTPLYHQASTGFFGTTKEMEENLARMKTLQDTMEKIVLQKTKITKEKLKEIYTNKIDWTINATEALKLGVVDEIIK